ncbi:B12-binding domain-containing radical SAM protein [Cecembia rubra]|uniref:Radical SAM family protein n=1 Tax=Cecembia rubra TaxID=1485585 RepID=A0A2P8EDE5_9BACT|nr:radical SAM protein [Cecembia rubra]PSL07471.1 radical SAM family protein [Cecembia rubra]
MSKSILLLTPPFTQLNTPYPATAYIKGYLNTLGKSAFQADLGINVILRIFSKPGLIELFSEAEKHTLKKISSNAIRIFKLKEEYIETIDPVIKFLQFENPTLAYIICEGDFLPQASRFDQLDDLEWAFGTMGIQDKARHLATLYLEDLADFIQEILDPHFGFSRYAERLGRSAVSFDPLHNALQSEPSFIDRYLIEELEKEIVQTNPILICLSVPFPGNLYGALRCGGYIKKHYPQVKVAMGGGYPNTELRSLKETRVFQYVDFITLDDGERPLTCLLEYLEGTREIHQLKRTFAIQDGKVNYYNGSKESDIPFSKTGTPDYTGLPLKQYLSVIEIANPMHRLWSDGRWNKLTMAHGCYWKKCTFCDITLDYIKNYEPVSASIICDRIEELIAQTGETGFHFVDEAAPPALMRELAIEILKRKIKISWWTNIRFEERFSRDLCRLLKASGCIAVSGGLEVASDRLLELMQKGVTVAQVARVARNFTEAGIMVHAYLMYGFPTQTANETIDSLEMVRQLFANHVLQSGFWHLFAMTSHAPIGLDPKAYQVVRTGPEPGDFADNDLSHDDPLGTDHDQFSSGLKKALFNYMHGICIDFPLQEWFDFRIPKTSVPANFIYKALQDEPPMVFKPNAKVIWLGSKPELITYSFQKKGKLKEGYKLIFEHKSGSSQIKLSENEAQWLLETLPLLQPSKDKKEMTMSQLKEIFENSGRGDFLKFFNSLDWRSLEEEGLVLV